MDSSGIGTRRTTKIGPPRILSAPGVGKRPRVASGLDLFWDDARCVDTDFLGATAGEITFERILQYYHRVPGDDSQLSGLGSDDLCLPQLGPHTGTAIPCSNSSRYSRDSTRTAGHHFFCVHFRGAFVR